jgi:hypothetical protein
MSAFGCCQRGSTDANLISTMSMYGSPSAHGGRPSQSPCSGMPAELRSTRAPDASLMHSEIKHQACNVVFCAFLCRECKQKNCCHVTLVRPRCTKSSIILQCGKLENREQPPMTKEARALQPVAS